MESTRAKLTKSMRMRAPEEFKQALRAKPIGRSKLFLLHYADTEHGTQEITPSQLGFIVPKRLLRLAVDRNRVKRVLRESFRLMQTDLPGGLYLFRLRATPEGLSSSGLKQVARQEADQLLSKLKTRKKDALVAR